MKQHNVMQLLKFKNFCESDVDLKELWKKLVKVGFKLRIIQDELILARFVTKDKVTSIEKSAEYENKKRAYDQILDSLKAACNIKNIKVPSFSHEEICDLYVNF